ncbi:MAG: hypothetical protein AAB459_03155 [Patescibacteria group bacterium]
MTPLYETDFALRLDSIRAEETFNHVLDMALDFCLRDRATFDSHLKAIQEDSENYDPVMLTLGTWGFQSILNNQELENDFEPLSKLRVDDALKHPLRYSDPLDKGILERIEAFGRSVIDEAFVSLGEPAAEIIESYKFHQDDKRILNEIYKLVANARDKGKEKQTVNNEEDTEDLSGIISLLDLTTHEDVVYVADLPGNSEIADAVETIEIALHGTEEPQLSEPSYEYHPFQSSPRMYGIYPNFQLLPNCLGVSILAAACLEKAGIPYLHAGVVMSISEVISVITSTISEQLKKQVSVNGVVSDEHVASVIERNLANMKSEDNDQPVHDVVVAKLKNAYPGLDLIWRICDPNYMTTGTYIHDEQEKISNIYNNVTSPNALIPNTQILNISKRIVELVDLSIALDMLTEINTLESAESFLDTLVEKFDSGKDWQSHYYTYIQSIFKSKNGFGGFADYLVSFLTKNNTRKQKNEELRRLYRSSMLNFLSEQEPKEVFDRIKKDSAYRIRRIEDLYVIPHVIYYRMYLLFANMVRDGYVDGPHPALEFGQPHFRIGAAVLNEYATRLNYQFPANFWNNYFPSSASFTDHIPKPEDPNHQRSRASHLGKLVMARRLQYRGKSGIISKFLEQERR